MLTGPPGANVGIHKGEIDFVVLYIGDPDSGVRYTMGEIPFTTSGGDLQDDSSVPTGFTITGVDNLLKFEPIA